MLLVFMSVISKWKVYILLPEGVKTTPAIWNYYFRCRGGRL